MVERKYILVLQPVCKIGKHIWSMKIVASLYARRRWRKKLHIYLYDLDDCRKRLHWLGKEAIKGKQFVVAVLFADLKE